MPPVLGAEQVESGSTGYTNGKQDTTRQNDADNIDETNTEASPLLQNGSSGFSSSTKPSPYLGNITRTRFWLIFSQLMICLLISCFDMTIMASSHPVITSYFHASHLASWLSTAPMVTMTVMQPLAGRVSDAVGRKPLFIGGMIVFTVATVWCSLATSIESFILARALLGFGGGTAMSLSAIILSDLVKIE
jgi:Na+/melibiose symporter-like transporter